MRTAHDDLVELATIHGVQSSYEDAEGSERRASPAVLVALLRALGVPLERSEDAAALSQRHRIERLQRRLEPVVVHRIDRGDAVTATLPSEAEFGSVWLGLELEDGTTSRCRLTAALTGTTSHEHPDSTKYGRVQFDLNAIAERAVPPGYHRVTLEAVGNSESALVIAAPNCPSGPQRWGAFLPLHALRTEQDRGIGTYSDLVRLAEWVSALGGGLVGTLPLYPAFLEHPADPSPYLPVSRLAYNELFIDPTVLPEFEPTYGGRIAVDRIGVDRIGVGRIGRSEAPSSASLVDYEEVSRLKREILEPMAHVVCSGGLPDRRRSLDDFAAAHPELVAYARFRAGREGNARGDAPDPTAVEYHLYCQWVASEQLAAAGRPTGRYADFPAGSHPDGFDPVWAPASFVAGAQGGSPPDRFFSSGQTWGFRPLHPERMREDGYRFLRAALRRAFRHADCLRVDHVMGLERMYVIPEGHDASEGTYVSYRAEELHALVALEAYLAGAVVVGEDLGTVPTGVRRRMARDHMLRTWVFQFESTAEQPLPQPPSNCLASLGTHDLPRFGAYLWGEDITEREAASALTPDEAETERVARARWRLRLLSELRLSSADMSTEELTQRAHERCLRHLARSDAQLVLVDLEETWDERQSQNHPGTASSDNWSHRARRTFEDFSSDAHLASLLSELGVERAS